ncbi:hypothetical protein [Halolamina sp.]|jgi:hypothetical protein|uniref:DUF7545 family protein n=1 Tax=Halolamina sp. TaxID=1940283 RepID=UPI000223B80D|nr:hypothetical protein Halar_0766 [halophilic archaeon DL31]
MVESHTYTIEGPDGETDSVEIPENLIELMQEGDKSGAGVVADIVLQAFAQQGHARVHHAEDGISDEMEEANEQLEERFEERFGISLADAMGHQH